MFTSLIVLFIINVVNAIRKPYATRLKLERNQEFSNVHRLAAKSSEYVYPVLRIYAGEELELEVITQREEMLGEQTRKFKQKTLAVMLSTFGKLPVQNGSSGAFVPEIYSDAMLAATLKSNPKTVIYFYKSFCQSCTELQQFYEQLYAYYTSENNAISFFRANIDYLPEWKHQFQLFLRVGAGAQSDWLNEEVESLEPVTSSSRSSDICPDCHGEGAVICPVCKGKKFILQNFINSFYFKFIIYCYNLNCTRYK